MQQLTALKQEHLGLRLIETALGDLALGRIRDT